MAHLIRVPELGIAIANVTIVEWLAQEGEKVSRGQPLLNVETDKIVMEVPAEADGALLKIIQDEGAQLTIGAPIAVIGRKGEVIDQLLAEAGTGVAAGKATKPQVARDGNGTPPPPVPTSPSGKVLASPLAKRIARERGIDLSRVTPTGKGHRITKEDVLAFGRQEALEEKPGKRAPVSPETGATPAAEIAEDEVEIIPLRGTRKAIADNMVRAVRTAAHYSMGIDVDCTLLVAMRDRLRGEFGRIYGLNLTYVPFVVKAMAMAVRDQPIANATLRGDHILIQKVAHVGVAVAHGDFIFVPVIRRPVERTLLSVARELEDLVAQVREERITPEKLRGGTITLTNMGAEVNTYPGLSIVNPPEVTSVAMGRVSEQVVPVDGQMAIKPILKLTFSYDHRVVMGIPGGRYADRVKHYLENPELLLAS